jgi:5-methyltetrahydropteroyltriglutamate--homocysteine methyltransferase
MLRTTVIGNWPLPPRFANVLHAYQRREVLEARAESVLREAAAVAMREQKSTGVNRITGGEMFADPDLGHLVRHLSGIEVVSLEDGGERQPPGQGYYRLVGSVGAPRGLGYATALRRERALEASLTVATCPGPMSVLSPLLRSDPSALSAMADATSIVQREIRALVREGAREVQLDLPSECAALQLFNLDPIVVAGAVESAFRGIRNVERTAHFCFRMLHGSGFTQEQNVRSVVRVLALLSGKIDRVLIECAGEGARELLAQVPPDMEVIAGIAGVDEVSPVDVLVRRGRDALRFVAAERLWLAPACGLRSCTSERAVQILGNVVAAARRLPH